MNSLFYNTFKNGVLLFLVVSMSILNIPASSTAEVEEQIKLGSLVLEPSKSKNVVLNPTLGGSSTLGKTKIELDPKIQNQADDVAEKKADDVIQSPDSSISAEKEKIITLPTAEDDEQTQHVPPVIEPAKSKDIILNPTPGKIKIETELPKEITETTTDGMTMLYIGGAIAGVAILAGALAANSSSSDSSPVPVEPPIPVVGPDLGGTDWLGFLDIKDKNHRGYQAISARIVHSGDAVQITTTSTLDYGKQLSGTISKGGFMLMYDSVTGEDWTTHFDNATSKRIDLYDYVNHLNDLDRMKLTR